MGPICVIPTVLYGWVYPTCIQWIWLILLSILSTVAHFTFSKAYALAEVTFLMPFGISKFLLCSIIGFIVFGEIPTTFSMWVGLIMILTSTVVLSCKNITWYYKIFKT